MVVARRTRNLGAWKMITEWRRITKMAKRMINKNSKQHMVEDFCVGENASLHIPRIDVFVIGTYGSRFHIGIQQYIDL